MIIVFTILLLHLLNEMVAPFALRIKNSFKDFRACPKRRLKGIEIVGLVIWKFRNFLASNKNGIVSNSRGLSCGHELIFRMYGRPSTEVSMVPRTLAFSNSGIFLS